MDVYTYFPFLWYILKSLSLYCQTVNKHGSLHSSRENVSADIPLKTFGSVRSTQAFFVMHPKVKLPNNTLNSLEHTSTNANITNRVIINAYITLLVLLLFVYQHLLHIAIMM